MYSQVAVHVESMGESRTYVKSWWGTRGLDLIVTGPVHVGKAAVLPLDAALTSSCLVVILLIVALLISRVDQLCGSNQVSIQLKNDMHRLLV